MVVDYLLVCDIDTGYFADELKKEVFSRRTYEDVKVIEEILIDISYAFYGWTDDIDKIESKELILKLINKLREFKVYFEEDCGNYFVPQYMGFAICKYDSIDHKYLSVNELLER